VEPSQPVAALQAGAQGYISAATPAEIVKHALPLVAGGGMFAPPFLYGGIPGMVAHGGEAAAPVIQPPSSEPRELHHLPEPIFEESLAADLAIFTDRELEVLRLLGTGLPNKLIAHHLSLKEGTVKVHMRNVMKKLKVRSRTQAALFASRHFQVERPLI
jgi:DNA-binding NarL/FixJ family response regulator